MTCDLNFWVVGAQIATPFAIGIVGWWFAHRQVRIAENKLRLDHFEKRYSVFLAARAYLGAAMRGKVAAEDENAFLEATAGASFLFKDQGVSDYLRELRKRTIDLHFLSEDVERASTEADRKVAGDRWLAERKWMRDQYDELEAKFMPHIQLRA